MGNKEISPIEGLDNEEFEKTRDQIIEYIKMYKTDGEPIGAYKIIKLFEPFLKQSGNSVAEMMKASYRAGKKEIKCDCDNEIKTGQTSVMCCNICGKPDEDFWSTGPLSFKEIFHGQLKKEVFKGQQNKIIELRKENELLMGVIDKLMNESNPSYNEAEREIIKDSVDRHMGKEFEAAYMRTKK